MTNPIWEYWEAIDSGQEVVSKKIYSTYKKLVYDLDNPSEYFYSCCRANHAIQFIERYCKHSKGKMGGKPVILELWEKAMIAAMFGFVDINGNRKYREAMLIVGKKNGVQVENTDEVPANAAFMFEITTDQNKVRHLMYNCSVTKPGMEAAAKGESIENKTDKLSFSARPAKDTEDIKAKVYSDNAKYNTWFDAVYIKGGTPAVLVTPTDVTFDKKTANQKDLVLNLLPAGSETLSSIKNGTTALTSTTHYTNTSNVVTIKSAYLATLGCGIVPLLFTFSNGQTRTVYVNVVNTASA